MLRNTIHRPDLWTKSEYARHIKKSATHVNNLIEEGKIISVKINGGELVQHIPSPPEEEIKETLSEIASPENVTM